LELSKIRDIRTEYDSVIVYISRLRWKIVKLKIRINFIKVDCAEITEYDEGNINECVSIIEELQLFIDDQLRYFPSDQCKRWDDLANELIKDISECMKNEERPYCITMEKKEHYLSELTCFYKLFQNALVNATNLAIDKTHIDFEKIYKGHYPVEVKR
jgi:hypothetical protein